MTQNPQERPEPPAFPAVNRPPAPLQPPPAQQEPGQQEPAQQQAPSPAAAEAGAERPPMTRREARAAREAQQQALTHEAVGPTSPPGPGHESPAETAALAGLDFDAVITGPVAQIEEPEPVGVAARHGSDEQASTHHDHPARTLFGMLEDTDDAPAHHRSAHDDSAHTVAGLVWRQQNYVSHDEPRKKRRWVRRLVVTIVVLGLLGGMAGGAYAIFQPQIVKLQNALFPPDDDYKGTGTGEVMFTIKSGDDGSSISQNLAKAGVVKTYDAFYSLLLRQKPQAEFQPGVFKLAKQMSAAAALAALEDPASRVQNTAVIPEGTAEKDALQTVATATKIPLADLQAAAANPAAYGLPAQAKSLEGFLFPATYTFPPGTTAQQAIKTMVDRMFQSLDAAGVAPQNRWNTVILASIVQREAGLKDDYPKVARVFLNRLAQGWDLQSDATVAYGTGHTNRVETTDAEREDASNPYNTYVHPGLPVGPISNPGDLAINAVQHPADGPWMYFVTWNLKTGETIFSTTQAEHDAAVAKWQQWMKDNPGYG
ncbi:MULTISPECIES: endolytic transglycosylase MltG [unclassified Leifsonia]|uniref:endolytic transglycosylase MltG n=1 Tax=unclassified Leifsonia TaxID=2663824 RepID=UPI0008A81654|nr:MULTISPECIES: endolytic transglycosylase MltG [unclassified Leifsonia]SEH93916.1 UPF0755 protein [Leifsonia sp. CL154]SFL59600.1 UPF0755 protein [Leifsonia sp. CL147]